MRTAIALTLLAGSAAWAQVSNPAQKLQQPEGTAEAPIFRTSVVAKTTKAVNYRHRGGSTKVDLRGTALMPMAKGEARVESKQGVLKIDAKVEKLQPATMFGPEYLTFVMWAISPEGRPSNLGEVLLNGGAESKLSTTTELQVFGIIVTAEPYFGVTQPSDVVVMENEIRQDTLGKIEDIDAKFELLPRGVYNFNAKYRPAPMDPKTPLELYEARNAVEIARRSGADKYAQDSFVKAEAALKQAEGYQGRKNVGSKPVSMIAREAVQQAEDSRVIAIRRIEEERLEQEREESRQKQEAARKRAEEEARQRALAEERQREEEKRRLEAEKAQAAAQVAAAIAAKERAEAEVARMQAEAARAAAVAQQQAAEAATAAAKQQAEAARIATEEANRLRMQAEANQAALRKQLLDQFNFILETRDTPRGLVVNMADVLFDSGQFTLRPEAREKLAKLSGVVLAHAGLRLDIEGHTDSVGSEGFNQTLSEKRAGAVRDYLSAQHLNPDMITAKGLGKTMPVAPNDTPAGRKQNRRVEIIVSGEVIGTNLTAAPRSAQ